MFENRECQVKNIAPFRFVVQSISVYGLKSVQSGLDSLVRFVVVGRKEGESEASPLSESTDRD